MIDRFRDFARALLTVLLLGVTGAAAQSSQSLTSPPGAAPQGASASSIQAGAVPAGPTGPQINTAEITARANHDVGVNIETTITGWQHELDRLESDLRGTRLRYSELNGFRDELQLNFAHLQHSVRIANMIANRPRPGVTSRRSESRLPARSVV